MGVAGYIFAAFRIGFYVWLVGFGVTGIVLWVRVATGPPARPDRWPLTYREVAHVTFYYVLLPAAAWPVVAGERLLDYGKRKGWWNIF